MTDGKTVRQPSREAVALQKRLLSTGPTTMSDTDLLGVVLGSPNLARAVARHVVCLHEAHRARLSRIPGFNERRVAQVLALTELSGRIASRPLPQGQPICCSDDVNRAYGPRYAGEKQEHFLALALDNRNRVIAEHLVAKGTISSVEVHPREVFRELIKSGAARAIVVHNHPSGDPRPSSHDTAICRRLCEAGTLIGVALLDFIIVGAQGSTSFRDLGLMTSKS